jgi:hypothetical protein
MPESAAGFHPISANLRKSYNEKECILSRRDQIKVARHEVPGNKRKVDPSRRDD